MTATNNNVDAPSPSLLITKFNTEDASMYYVQKMNWTESRLCLNQDSRRATNVLKFWMIS